MHSSNLVSLSTYNPFCTDDWVLRGCDPREPARRGYMINLYTVKPQPGTISCIGTSGIYLSACWFEKLSCKLSTSSLWESSQTLQKSSCLRECSINQWHRISHDLHLIKDLPRGGYKLQSSSSCPDTASLLLQYQRSNVGNMCITAHIAIVEMPKLQTFILMRSHEHKKTISQYIIWSPSSFQTGLLLGNRICSLAMRWMEIIHVNSIASNEDF